MARTASDEELQLKKRARRRLVGAVVLATTVAVVLPMVLDNEPKPVSRNVNIQIPSPDAPAVAPKAPAASARRDDADGAGAQPSPGDAQPAQAVKPEAAPSPPAKPDAASPEKKEVPPAPPQRAAEPADSSRSAEHTQQAAAEAPKRDAKEHAPKAASAEAKTAATPPADAPKAAANGKFVVQVAALADTVKAKQLQQQMAGAGVRAYTEVVKTSKGNVTRVRAGPYDTREAAEKARGRLKSAGLDGKVVPR